jgi:putative zinc finger/helix-turn-helix YgiT family protein
MTTPNDIMDDVCVRCRTGKVSPVVLDAVYTREGTSVSFKEEFMRCDTCDREFFTTEQSMARSRAITDALRKHQGFMTGAEIRRVRDGYGLSLPDFEKALGVGKNTVGRWERGTVPPTGAANLGLWVAATAPDVFEKWARLRGVNIESRPQRAVVGTARITHAPTKSTPLLRLIGGHSSAASTHTGPLANEVSASLFAVGGQVS